MKDKLEISILESTASIRRILVGALWNMGRIVAILTLVISALVLFTDIGFSDFGTEGFTSTLLVMLLSSYIIYFSMEESGEKLGEQTEEYKKAIEEFSHLKNELTGEKIVALREFCRRYSLEELEYRKESFLIQNGICIYIPNDLSFTSPSKLHVIIFFTIFFHQSLKRIHLFIRGDYAIVITLIERIKLTLIHHRHK